MLQTGSIRMIL